MADTTTEAVEQLAAFLNDPYQRHAWATGDAFEEIATTLRALAQERDRISEYWKECAASRDAWIKKHDAMQAERDAARAEVARLRRVWLTTIQTENSCPATGGGCFAKRCGCLAEMEMLMREDDERAALTAKGAA